MPSFPCSACGAVNTVEDPPNGEFWRDSSGFEHPCGTCGATNDVNVHVSVHLTPSGADAKTKLPKATPYQLPPTPPKVEVGVRDWFSYHRRVLTDMATFLGGIVSGDENVVRFVFSPFTVENTLFHCAWESEMKHDETYQWDTIGGCYELRRG